MNNDVAAIMDTWFVHNAVDKASEEAAKITHAKAVKDKAAAMDSKALVTSAFGEAIEDASMSYAISKMLNQDSTDVVTGPLAEEGGAPYITPPKSASKLSVESSPAFSDATKSTTPMGRQPEEGIDINVLDPNGKTFFHNVKLITAANVKGKRVPIPHKYNPGESVAWYYFNDNPDKPRWIKRQTFKNMREKGYMFDHKTSQLYIPERAADLQS